MLSASPFRSSVAKRAHLTKLIDTQEVNLIVVSTKRCIEESKPRNNVVKEVLDTWTQPAGLFCAFFPASARNVVRSTNGPDGDDSVSPLFT